jgi:hypothetical protein
MDNQDVAQNNARSLSLLKQCNNARDFGAFAPRPAGEEFRSAVCCAADASW